MNSGESDFGWRRLREGGAGVRTELGVRTLALGTLTPAGPVRLALGDADEARLLVPLVAGQRFPNVNESYGLGLRDVVLNLHGRPVRFVDMVCRQRDLEEVFSRVVQQILERIDAGEPVDAAVEGAVRDFRRLLLRSGGDISAERAQGLVAELIVLEELLALSPRAWRAWTGPRGARHDFRAGVTAVEVKSTGRASSRRLTISALDQLLEPDGGALTLKWLALEATPQGEISVPVLAARVLARADDADALMTLLSAAGYEDENRDLWSRHAFTQLQSQAYSVAPGFPRIVVGSFAGGDTPRGVTKLVYDIDLAIAAPFAINADAWRAILRSLAEAFP